MKPCVTCGEMFEPTREWSKYCSSKCRHNNPDKIKTTLEFQRKRREMLNKIKTDMGCEVCGYNKHPAALDFDHKNPEEKSFNISQDTKRAWGKMLEEIEKCRVVCSNCHRIHTYEERHWKYRKEKQ